MELLAEGAQIMFYEPPANRRGLSRRLQDHVSWLGPAVVVAVERLDGVWLRYRNKLKGLPLEYVRMATACLLNMSGRRRSTKWGDQGDEGGPTGFGETIGLGTGEC